MNRQQRRNMKVINEGSNYLNTPCTIAETVQIARGVAEDVIADYQRNQSHLQIATSLQIEIIKECLFKANIISEDEFRKMYMEKAEELNRRQAEMLGDLNASTEDDSLKMEIKSNEIEVVKE